jgi:hypothetical protein
MWPPIEVDEAAERRVVMRVQLRVLLRELARGREDGVVEAQLAGPGQRRGLHAALELPGGRHLVGDVDGEARHREQEDHEPQAQEDRSPPFVHQDPTHRAPPRHAPHHRVNLTTSIWFQGMSTCPWGVRPLMNAVPRLT